MFDSVSLGFLLFPSLVRLQGGGVFSTGTPKKADNED